jgi:dihydroflavonol-4-reductase
VTILVTGGTGFLGAHVVRQIAAGGARVRVLARGGAGELEGLPVEVVRGDVVQDLDGGVPLERALDGVERVIHLAGFVSRDPADGQRMMRLHIDGTRRLMTAARAAGVRRMVIASSSGTIAVSDAPSPIPDESAPYATERVAGWPYYLSKIYQEKLALELARTLPLEVVIVSPSLLLGPGDARASSTGDVRRFLRGQIPVVPPGGLSLIDVRDAAAATVAALERGRAGERYLLGGPNWTFAEFFGRLERTSKVRGPRLRLPPRLAIGAASLVESAWRAVGREAPVERVSVEMAQLFWYCDAGRATRELGLVARDPGETLDDTVRDCRRRMV